MSAAIVTPNPVNFPKASFKATWSYPDASQPYLIKTNQKINLTANGLNYPGTRSTPPAAALPEYFLEVTINVISGSLTRSNFDLTAPGSWGGAGVWVGSSGLTYRVRTAAGGGSGGINGSPGFWPDFEPVGTVHTLQLVNYTAPTDAKFTLSMRFIVPTWNNQTVNWYYTVPTTTPQYTATNQPFPCSVPAPSISFQYSATWHNKNLPWTLRRKNYPVVGQPAAMPSNHLTLRIINPVNIPSGSTFEFQIINVSGDVNHVDLTNITWHDRNQKTWRLNTSGTTGTVITRTIVGANPTQGTEQFKIKIIYRPGTRPGPGGCTWTYSPVVAETPIISLIK